MQGRSVVNLARELDLCAVRRRGSLVEVDEQASAWFAVDVATDVTLAGGVLRKQDLSGTERAASPVARLDLDGTGEVDDELSSRRNMEVELVVTGDFAELDAAAGPQLRDPPERSEVVELDVDVLEV